MEKIKELTYEELSLLCSHLMMKYGDIKLSTLKTIFIKEDLKQQGKYFPCPNCKEKGTITKTDGYTKKRCSEEEARINAGYSGSFYPDYYDVDVPNIITIECKYCKGLGYTEKELKPIIKTEIVGYE